MNNEIKEILDLLQEDIESNILIEVRSGVFKPLLDYITNLQQENERLKEENKYLDKLRNANYLSWQDSLSRIEKAVEYIMSELVDEWSIKNNGCVSGSDLPVNAITPILDILNGRSDE